MFVCSAAFNAGQRYWAGQRARLTLIDHVGICLLIAGSFTPVLGKTCNFRALAFVWLTMISTAVAKWSRGPFDRLLLHVLAFVLGPFGTVIVIHADLNARLTPHELGLIYWCGATYVGGLIPWRLGRRFEFHIAIWHVCVVVGSGLVYALVYDLVETAEKAAALEHDLRACLREGIWT